jgi:Rod binding domain-containing protein
MRVMQTMVDPQMGTTQQPRLVKAAHEFEAQMMKELLKPMAKGETLEGDADSSSGSALEDFAAEALGQGISSRGGLGIADEIIRSLSRNGTKQSNLERAPGNLQVGGEADSSKVWLRR